MMKLRWLLAGALGVALVAAGVGIGIASNESHDGPPDRMEATEDEDDGDESIRGADAERAGAAALEYASREYADGGRVTEVEVGDDGAAYGVEVLLPDGRQIEVQLDAGFDVIGDEIDDE